MVLDQRQHAHALLDLLSPDKLGVVHSLLEVLVEPLAISLTRVPMDDEPLTDEMLEKLQRAEASAGQRIPHEQILEEFGLRS